MDIVLHSEPEFGVMHHGFGGNACSHQVYFHNLDPAAYETGLILADRHATSRDARLLHNTRYTYRQ